MRNVPELLLVSLMKNLTPGSHQTSAWARDTTFDLNASLFELRALAWEIGTPERSVNRPMRSAGSPSTTSRMMGSKRRERRLSRCGTRRIRCAVPVGTGPDVLETAGMLVGWGVVGTTAGICGVLDVASAPPERRLRRIWVMPEERGRLWEMEGCRVRPAVDRRLLEEGPGEGGKASMWGTGKGGGESRSSTGEGYWDWEVPRGRPRKKDVRIFCLVGGESELTAWGTTPSMERGTCGEIEIGGWRVERRDNKRDGRWANPGRLESRVGRVRKVSKIDTQFSFLSFSIHKRKGETIEQLNTRKAVVVKMRYNVQIRFPKARQCDKTISTATAPSPSPCRPIHPLPLPLLLHPQRLHRPCVVCAC